MLRGSFATLGVWSRVFPSFFNFGSLVSYFLENGSPERGVYSSIEIVAPSTDAVWPQGGAKGATGNPWGRDVHRKPNCVIDRSASCGCSHTTIGCQWFSRALHVNVASLAASVYLSQMLPSSNGGLSWWSHPRSLVAQGSGRGPWRCRVQSFLPGLHAHIRRPVAQRSASNRAWAALFGSRTGLTCSITSQH